MSRSRDDLVQERFARQAEAFARSPLQRDPERLRRLLAFAGARRGEAAVDLGCGPGIVTAALAAAGVEATGVDLTPEMLRLARRSGGPCVRANLARLPFREGVFDLALCRNTLHHLADPETVAREMARVVRPGGRAVIEDMRAPDDPARREVHETIERLRDPAHARTLSEGEMRDLLQRSGLTGLRIEPVAWVIDAEEWMDRAYPAPEDRRRAIDILEECLARDLAGIRVWREEGRLKFERRSLLASATRPA